MIKFESYSDIPKDFTGICKVADSGNIYHLKDGKPHNENGPAFVNKNGSKFWYIDGFKHREDGPAAEYSNVQKDWYYKNKRYGVNFQFTVKSWKEKVEQLKREEELEIFK